MNPPQPDTVIEKIRFYRANGKYGFLSNLYPSVLIFDHMVFSHAEAAYQFGKPKDPDVAQWLIKAPKPHICAIAAHALLPYDIREDWNEIKVERMRKVLAAKFECDPCSRKSLVDTGDAILIEESKTDAFWGTGKNGNGKNMLGILLMELREKIRENPHFDTIIIDESRRKPLKIQDLVPTPPDYKYCPCWISPIDPESNRGSCEGDGGDCKLWHHNPYTECKHLATGCKTCDEVLCKFRNDNLKVQ